MRKWCVNFCQSDNDPVALRSISHQTYYSLYFEFVSCAVNISYTKEDITQIIHQLSLTHPHASTHTHVHDHPLSLTHLHSPTYTHALTLTQSSKKTLSPKSNAFLFFCIGTSFSHMFHEHGIDIVTYLIILIAINYFFYCRIRTWPVRCLFSTVCLVTPDLVFYTSTCLTTRTPSYPSCSCPVDNHSSLSQRHRYGRRNYGVDGGNE